MLLPLLEILSLPLWMHTATPIEYEPAYDANGNEVGGVYSYNDFSVTTDFTSGSEVVAAVDYY